MCLSDNFRSLFIVPKDVYSEKKYYIISEY